MKKRAAQVIAVVLTVLGLLVVPTAQASFAASPHIAVHLSSSTVPSGGHFTVTAHANVLCDWIVDFHGGKTHTVSRSIRTTLVAPEVDQRTRFPLVVTCVLHTLPTNRPAPTARGIAAQPDVQTLVVRIPPNTHQTIPVIVDPGAAVEPPNAPGGSGLPGTGGPRLWLLLAGLGALLLGSAVVRRSRQQVVASAG